MSYLIVPRYNLYVDPIFDGWLNEWCFMPLSTVFQSYHGDSSHYSYLSRVSPVLAGALKGLSYLWTVDTEIYWRNSGRWLEIFLCKIYVYTKLTGKAVVAFNYSILPISWTFYHTIITQGKKPTENIFGKG